LNVMSEYTEEDVKGMEGRERLAAALRVAINEKLMLLEQFGGIEEVHFTSFVMQ
jgi:flagellar FliL protein